MIPKKVVQQLLEILPDTCTYEDIQHHIQLFENVCRNQEAVMLGATVSLELEHYPKQ